MTSHSFRTFLPLLLSFITLGACAQSESSAASGATAAATTIKVLLGLDYDDNDYAASVVAVDGDATTIVYTCTENDRGNATSTCYYDEPMTGTVEGTSSWGHTSAETASDYTWSAWEGCLLLDQDERSMRYAGTISMAVGPSTSYTTTSTSTYDSTMGAPTLHTMNVTAGAEKLQAKKNTASFATSGSSSAATHSSGEEAAPTQSTGGVALGAVGGMDVVKVLVAPGAALLAVAGW